MATQVEPKSLYERLGGKDAVHAAVDLFYQKVLADNRIKHLFDGVNMAQQRAKQETFMTYAFGGRPDYPGLSLRKAHERLVRDKGMNEDHFNAVAEDLTETLKELNVPPELIAEVIAIIGSARNDVLSK